MKTIKLRVNDTVYTFKVPNKTHHFEPVFMGDTKNQIQLSHLRSGKGKIYKPIKSELFFGLSHFIDENNKATEKLILRGDPKEPKPRGILSSGDVTPLRK